MSCTFFWIPVVEDKNYIADFNLRDILINKFGYHGRLNHTNIEYLEGLVDGGLTDAQELIDAIHKHDVIEIGQEC